MTVTWQLNIRKQKLHIGPMIKNIKKKDENEEASQSILGLDQGSCILMEAVAVSDRCIRTRQDSKAVHSVYIHGRSRPKCNHAAARGVKIKTMPLITVNLAFVIRNFIVGYVIFKSRLIMNYHNQGNSTCYFSSPCQQALLTLIPAYVIVNFTLWLDFIFLQRHQQSSGYKAPGKEICAVTKSFIEKNYLCGQGNHDTLSF